MSDQERSAMQQALEALEAGPDVDPIFAGETQDALRAALAQQPEPVQEPYCRVYEYDSVFGLHRELYPREYNGRKPDRAVPLYTDPPQRKPLTDEEITDAVREADLDWQAGWTLDEHEPNRFTTLARAVERKVRGE